MSASRRLPVYLLIDTSGSMRGEPIESVNVGLRAMQTSLRQNPYAIETVHLSITTFDSEVKDVLPLTPLEDAMVPEIVCPKSGATLLGEALEHILQGIGVFFFQGFQCFVERGADVFLDVL